MTFLAIGSATVVEATAVTADQVMKTAALDGFKFKVKAMEKEGNFEYIAIEEVSYKYTRTLIRESSYPSMIAPMKSNTERNGKSILVVVRQKDNGVVNFILLKRPSNNNKKRFDKNNPLKGCSVDLNLKTNHRGIVESRNLKVMKIGSNNIFQLEDTNYRSAQTHRKVLEINIMSSKTKKSSDNNRRSNGEVLCELLTYMAKNGRVPKYLSSSRKDCEIKNDNEDDNTVCSLHTVSSSSPSFVEEEDPLSEAYSLSCTPYVNNKNNKSRTKITSNNENYDVFTLLQMSDSTVADFQRHSKQV